MEPRKRHAPPSPLRRGSHETRRGSRRPMRGSAHLPTYSISNRVWMSNQRLYFHTTRAMGTSSLCSLFPRAPVEGICSRAFASIDFILHLSSRCGFLWRRRKLGRASHIAWSQTPRGTRHVRRAGEADAERWMGDSPPENSRLYKVLQEFGLRHANRYSHKPRRNKTTRKNMRAR